VLAHSFLLGVEVTTVNIHHAHEQLLAAAAGELPFSNAIDSLVGVFGGEGGVVFELNRRTGVISNWVSPTLRAGDDDYSNHINAINPRMHYSLRHAQGHIVYEGKFIDDRSMDRHEFYDWLGNVPEMDLRYFIGSRVYDAGDVTLFHSIEFSSNHGHVEPDKIQAFAHAAKAVGHAWKLAGRASTNNSIDGKSPWTPDYLPWAIFALSPSGHIVEKNARADELLESRNALYVSDGQLDAFDRASSDELSRSLLAGYAGDSSETLIATAGNGAPLIAQIVPACPSGLTGPNGISIVVYVWNPAQQGRDLGKVMARLWGFTPAETKLAGAMVQGNDLNTAADQLGISRNTAKNQLQKMFAKTGTRRQSELLVRLLGLLET